MKVYHFGDVIKTSRRAAPADRQTASAAGGAIEPQTLEVSAGRRKPPV